jgi:hypothetical protein
MAASGILAGLKLADEVIYRILRRDIMQESTVYRSMLILGSTAESPSPTPHRTGRTEDLPEGVRVLVTVLPDDETEFWHQASQPSLDAMWNNAEDDVYAQLRQA